jgi:ribonucleoside-triphosphate reductase
VTQFRLSDAFLASYKNRQPNWGFNGLGYVVYKRTYARPIHEENRTEEWWETVRRVVEGTYDIQRNHCLRYRLPWSAQKAQASAHEMYERIFCMKFLPPGRGLWMMGTPFIAEKGGAALNNCSFVSTENLRNDLADPFCFLMDMSMLGVGVGGDTKGAGTIVIRAPKLEGTYVVDDSREGWVDLIRRVLTAYHGRATMPTDVDYSLVRGYGLPIKGFGGTSSGPAPLQQLVIDIQSILDPLVGESITSTAIVDLFNCIGKCVVAGNVRRTAEILFAEPTDAAFLELKDPNLNAEMLNKWRWASNNSIFSTVGMDYTRPAELTALNGEPGYFWLKTAQDYGRLKDLPDGRDHRVKGSNPCVEQSLESYELCNLVETFPAAHDTYADYQRTLKFAYLYAKTVTLIPTHDERTNAVMLRNRRIGMSQSGVMQSIAKHGLRNHFDWCDKGYAYTQKLDELYSEWLCIPRSVKMTSVKPSGTVSLLAGATPGIHASYAEYYWRTVRFEKHSPLVSMLRAAGYRVFDTQLATTCVVYFPVQESNFYKSRSDLTIWEQLELAAQMQFYWADNQVSVTVTFRPEEANSLKMALELYETRLKSVSFLPLLDHGYEHAPYQPMTQDEYERAIAELRPLQMVNGTHTEGDQKKFCDNDVCEVSK